MPSEFHSSSATRKGDTGPLASKLRNEAEDVFEKFYRESPPLYAMQIELFEINWRDKLPPTPYTYSPTREDLETWEKQGQFRAPKRSLEC